MWWVWLGLHLILTSRTERPVLSHLSCKFSGCFKGLNKDQPSVPHFIFSEGQIRCYFLRSHRVDSCPGTRDSSHFYLRIIYRRLYHTTHTVVHKQPADVTVSFPTLSDVVLSNLWIHVIVIRRCQGWFTPRLLEKWSGRILKDIDFVLFHFVKYLRNLCCSVHRWINTGYNTQSLMSLFFSECKQKKPKTFHVCLMSQTNVNTVWLEQILRIFLSDSNVCTISYHKLCRHLEDDCQWSKNQKFWLKKNIWLYKTCLQFACFTLLQS